MKKVQHEKINVLKPCLQLCKSLEANGIILSQRRMSELEWYHKIGDADIRIELMKDCTLWLILCECKRDDGKGRQETNQKKVQKKYELCHNVVYMLVEDVQELEDMIMKLTGYQISEKKRLNDIEYNP